MRIELNPLLVSDLVLEDINLKYLYLFQIYHTTLCYFWFASKNLFLQFQFTNNGVSFDIIYPIAFVI